MRCEGRGGIVARRAAENMKGYSPRSNRYRLVMYCPGRLRGVDDGDRKAELCCTDGDDVRRGRRQ